MRKGFTLIEIMIVVALLAILAAVAVSIYNNFIKAGFEVDPVNVLMQAATAQEQYRADNNCYAQNIEDLSGFNDGSVNNEFVLHSDKDPRRKVKIYVETANCTYYKISLENYTTDPKWKIKWHIECSAGAPVGSCKPVQDKGSSALRSVF